MLSLTNLDWNDLGDIGGVKRDPIPVVSEKDYESIKRQLEYLNSFQPATPEQISSELYLLKIRHYYTDNNLALNAYKQLIKQDIHDAREYPAYMFLDACKAWRKNPKNTHQPYSVAELMEGYQKYRRELMTLILKLKKIKYIRETARHGKG